MGEHMRHRDRMDHPSYRIWIGMRGRCNNPRNAQYARYGGRGIRVCERWNDSFDAFVEDMGARPAGKSIDRIDNDGNYEPGNCRWTTHSEQMRNQSVTRRVTVGGVTYIAKDLAEQIGMKTDTIMSRSAVASTLDEILSVERRVYKPGLALGGAANGARQKAKTHCPAGHPYSGHNLSFTPLGYRYCKACKAKKQLERTARKRG